MASKLADSLAALIEACDTWHAFQHVKDDPITMACEDARRVLEDAGYYTERRKKGRKHD